MSRLLSKLRERGEEEEDEEGSSRHSPHHGTTTPSSKVVRTEGEEDEGGILDDEKKKKKRRKRRCYPSVILCGDFNCQPGSGGLRLLQDKKVGRALDDWNDGIHLPFTFLDTPRVLRVSYPYARTLYIYVRICVARSVYVYVPTS